MFTAGFLDAHPEYPEEDELPTAETIGTKLNQLGYYPKKVAKSQPLETALEWCFA